MSLFRRLLLGFALLSVASSACAQVAAGRSERSPSKKWAILIGVNRYIHVADLRFCSRDIESLQKSLIGLGFPDRNIFMLHDGAKERKK